MIDTSCETCSEHSGVVARLNSLEDQHDDMNGTINRVDTKLDWMIGLMVAFMVGFPSIMAVIM